jgi:integrase
VGGSLADRATGAGGVLWVASEGVVLLVAVETAVRRVVRLTGRKGLAQDRGGLDGRRLHTVANLGQEPVFPDSQGGWRDPSNTRRALPNARGTEEFTWVTSHVFRKTALTMLDDAGLSARLIADQAGHSQVSTNQDVYMARKVVDGRAANVLDQRIGQVFSMH